MNFRKARTRTLIQAGGLLEKAGVLEALQLSPGHDLQKNQECFEEIAILMGALTEIRETLIAEDSGAQKMIWGERGKEILRKPKV